MNLSGYRDQFIPVRDGRIFLNHAGVSPMSDRTAQAMKRAIDGFQGMTPEEWMTNEDGIARCRRALSSMLNVPESDLALTRNTTDGVNWVANGLSWNPGDRVVSINGEYPTNHYPWLRLQNKDVEFHLIEPIHNRVTLDQIDDALTPNTRVLAVSWVQFVSGFRIDLEAVGALCAEKNVLFVVDVIQGMGALPLDLKKGRVSFASGGAQKWMIGPQGAGFFYCPKENLDLLEPVHVGADSVINHVPYLDYDFTLRPDARRFEYSTLPVIPLIGLGAAAELLLEVGMETVGERIKSLTDCLVGGLTAKGWICHSPRENNEWSGIVSFTHPTITIQEACSRLATVRAFTMEREGMLRLAPHFYQTEDEMQKVIGCL
ncbi:MAG: aminotransferase class V-fold PLP-dependent enzyme [Candidatus Hinthialibacter antarcticus]|nr:aminotransferase class V-fold PLP-dependent enzyme [Candidatus Hinthialibacter antarcticus]